MAPILAREQRPSEDAVVVSRRMKRQLRSSLSKALGADNAHTDTAAGEADLAAVVSELEKRVTELEAEMQETRRLNRRLAELTDVVQELLLPLAQRDEAGALEQLQRYSSSL